MEALEKRQEELDVCLSETASFRLPKGASLVGGGCKMRETDSETEQ